MKPMPFFWLVMAVMLTACAQNTRVTQNSEAKSLPALTPARITPPKVQWDLEEVPDFTALREVYGKREDFMARCELGLPKKKFAEYMAVKAFTSAAKLGLQWLEKCPVNAQLHLWVSHAFDKAGQVDKAKRHAAWFWGLTSSVLETGDGFTPETAFVTISISEEYAVLTRLKLTKISQSLIQGPDSPLDMIEAKNPSGRVFKVHFNPHWHFVRLAHQLP